MIHKSLIALVVSLVLVPRSYSQIEYSSLKPSQFNTIHQALDSIYSLNFDGAEPLIVSITEEIPDYPGVYLLKAYFLAWKYKPISSGQPSFDSLISVSEKVIEKSEMMLEYDAKNPEAIFYILGIHAMLARLYVDVDMNWKAIKEAQKAYKYLKKGIDYVDQFPELNLYCGLYNYYRVKYPQENPYVKPVLWFFMNGDENKGLKMLSLGSEKGLFTKIECYTYLYFINFRYEFKPLKSIEYAEKLYNWYPDNETFISLLVENRIFLKEFEHLEVLVDQLECSNSPYYRLIGTIYNGLIVEMYYLNLDEALAKYKEAEDIKEENDLTTPHYESMCLLGIGRIYLEFGNEAEARKYLKKAASISEYSFIRDEAKILLKSQKYPF